MPAPLALLLEADRASALQEPARQRTRQERHQKKKLLWHQETPPAPLREHPSKDQLVDRKSLPFPQELLIRKGQVAGPPRHKKPRRWFPSRDAPRPSSPPASP